MKRTGFGVRLAALAATAGVALLVAGCPSTGTGGAGGSASSGGGDSSGPIVIGEYGSLTGSEATFGTSTDDGVKLAIEEINNAGGINGRKLEVRVEDDQSQSSEAALAVQKLIDRDRVTAIIGEVASGNSLAAAPICQNKQVPMISPASTNPDVTKTGDYIFRVCFIDPFQGEVMAKFAAENLKLKKVAIFKDQGAPYSTGLATNFRTAFTGLGGIIVAEEAYSATDTDFKAQLAGIKARQPDGIFIPGYYTQVGTIGRQARELGIQVPLFGGDGWDSPKLFEAAGTALEGCYFSNHYSAEDPSEAIQNFIKTYKARYNGRTPDAMAALGYDATRVLADAMKRARSLSGPDLRDAIAETQDFPGVTGKITINAERNAVKPAVVLQLKGTSYKYVTTIQP
jgi:branched-chain amino acid transport system substrate-binding protein